SAASAEIAKSEPSAEKKPSQSKDDYYELYKLLADTVDQVDRNYVKEVDRGGYPWRDEQARSLLELHRPGGTGPVPQFGGQRIRWNRYSCFCRRRRLESPQPYLWYTSLSSGNPGRRSDRRDRG